MRFQHPDDTISESHIQLDVSSYETFVSALERGNMPRSNFHLHLLPQPYFGDLEDAEILILLANPGLSASDYFAEETCPEYRDELIGSLRQEKRSHMFLDPKWAWTSGFSWWERKFRSVAQCIATEHFDGHYGNALADLARRVASVELVPYHSFNFRSQNQLASVQAARDFASTVASDRKVIVTRSVTAWELPEADNFIKYKPEEARSASLGLETCGGKAILEVYENRPCIHTS
ncbi:hypothetical protein BMI88_14515 [Thioclava sp. F36-6]|nr:hypothetical protein BMI88_14515 [Thioclava sp. F36-6]